MGDLERMVSVDHQEGEQEGKPGVFVYVDANPTGFTVNYETLGHVDPLAIPAMLEHAARLARQRIGLPVDRP